jgi:hypothetical protein
MKTTRLARPLYPAKSSEHTNRGAQSARRMAGWGERQRFYLTIHYHEEDVGRGWRRQGKASCRASSRDPKLKQGSY